MDGFCRDCLKPAPPDAARCPSCRSLLILDDSTSSVDLQTEYNIQKALDNLMHGRTSFVIAQRISTVLNADQILVLDKGRVAARGTHEELMESSPIYAEIYHSQLIGDAVTR